MITLVTIGVLFVIVGTYLGWHSNRAYSAHGDIRQTKRGRLPTFRRARRHSALRAVITAVILLLVLIAAVH